MGVATMRIQFLVDMLGLWARRLDVQFVSCVLSEHRKFASAFCATIHIFVRDCRTQDIS